MSIQINELIELLARLCEDKHMKATATMSLKGGALTGLAATFGGLLFGPVGLAIGGAIGGIGSAYASHGSFRPVAAILRDMNPVERQKLTDNLIRAFSNVGVKDAAALCLMIMSNSNFQEMAMRQLTSYLSNEMSMRIQT